MQRGDASLLSLASGNEFFVRGVVGRDVSVYVSCCCCVFPCVFVCLGVCVCVCVFAFVCACVFVLRASVFCYVCFPVLTPVGVVACARCVLM